MNIPNWRTVSGEEKHLILSAKAIEGWSAAEIATLFEDATRNAVIGFCRRHDIVLKKGKPKVISDENELAKQRVKADGGRIRPRRELTPEQLAKRKPPRPVIFVPKKGGKNILDIGRDECRFPLFDDPKKTPVSGLMFCGEPVFGEGMFCRECGKKAYDHAGTKIAEERSKKNRRYR